MSYTWQTGTCCPGYFANEGTEVVSQLLITEHVFNNTLPIIPFSSFCVTGFFRSLSEKIQLWLFGWRGFMFLFVSRAHVSHTGPAIIVMNCVNNGVFGHLFCRTVCH
ncbi:hypothetical protein XENOCAPTIV_009084 [Xenoophorus captivus]|uniref:Uncharacterized protein n=1 Tax=Xenoophorus captivus TaxID=1517983 RepID=A0ABV0RZK0_9TELE